MNDREILKQSIDKLQVQYNTINTTLIDLKNQYWKYDIEDNQKKYNKTFWVYRNNCESCPESEADFWDVYIYVKQVTDDNTIEIIRFELDKNLQIYIKEDKMSPVSILECYKQVDKKEISEKWFEIKQWLNTYDEVFK